MMKNKVGNEYECKNYKLYNVMKKKFLRKSIQQKQIDLFSFKEKI